jgi:hypothetical protein
MPALIADYLLLLWVVFSTFGLGIGLCARATRLNGTALIAYGAAIGVVVQGLFGLLIARGSHTRHSFAILLFVAAALGTVDLIRGRRWSRVTDGLTRAARMSLLLWLTFVVLCVAVTHLEVRWPEKLQPGMFIFQKHRLNTRVQYLAGLPSDNYIPYTVTEFLLRGISFKTTRPILPGNEVSNRTILMSLVALPYRALLSWGAHCPRHLRRVHSGIDMPDVESLNDDGSFAQFLVVGLFLNSLLLLGLSVLLRGSGGQRDARGGVPLPDKLLLHRSDDLHLA